MQHSAARVGDRVRYTGREGIVVHVDPLVLCLVEFHCYVAVVDEYAVIERDACPDAHVRPDVVERIKDYLRRAHAATPVQTGHDAAS